MRLLFEIGMEEIPARFLNNSLNDLKINLDNKFKKNRISFKKIETFGTPRRLILLVEGISEVQEDLTELNIGPSKSVSYEADNITLTKAALGFIKSQKIDPSEVEIVKTEKGEYIAAKKFYKGENTKELLPNILKELVLELSFPTSMKWSDKNLRFARPIEWFLAIFDNQVVEFEIEGIKSSNISKGHRFFGSEFNVENIDDYFKKIKENNVIIDLEERKSLIVDLINSKIGKNEKIVIDPNLLNEVTNLVEYPYPIIGTFNSEFLEVPQDVLIITMQTHQRYFPILDEKGKLLPKFILIRNGISDSLNVKKGNEKVLSARLADARFFYHEDLKIPLENNVEKLKLVVFQKDLGTIYDKIERVKSIAEYLIEKLDVNDKKDNILRTVYLAKADLVSNMINEKEYTKLQGFMGSNYASKFNEPKEVCLGIEEHYYPRFQGDIMPSAIEGIITGIADRIDTVVGCFAVGLIPSGSKDPFALRRAALAIVNIILDSNLNISLNELIKITIENFDSKNLIKNNKNSKETNIDNKEKLYNEVSDFFKQRLLNVFADMNFRKDIINSVLNKTIDNPIDILKRIEAIEEFVLNKDSKVLLSTIKRLNNIVKEKADIEISADLFKEDVEKELFLYTTELKNILSEYIKNKMYKEYLGKIVTSEEIINKYFENVMIMDEDLSIRKNRLAQLNELIYMFNEMALLNQVEEK